eukprot:tig00000743_g3873.t1
MNNSNEDMEGPDEPMEITLTVQMLVIVNDLLDAGKLVLESIPFDLRGVVEEVVEAVAPAAFAKGVELAAHVPPHWRWREGAAGEGGCEGEGAGDPRGLKQIVTNLTFNGVKFTHKGHVIVSVSVLSVSSEQVSFRVSVTDTGPGIADRWRVRRRSLRSEASPPPPPRTTGDRSPRARVRRARPRMLRRLRSTLAKPVATSTPALALPHRSLPVVRLEIAIAAQR